MPTFAESSVPVDTCEVVGVAKSNSQEPTNVVDGSESEEQGTNPCRQAGGE